MAALFLEVAHLIESPMVGAMDLYSKKNPEDILAL